MTTLLKKVTLAGIFALSLNVSAQAATTVVDAGLVSENWSTPVQTTTGSFMDLFNFSVAANNGAGLSAQAIMVNSVGTSLTSIALYLGKLTTTDELNSGNLLAFTDAVFAIGQTGSVFDNIALGFGSLAANTPYTMVISGNAAGNSSYTSIIQLAPVPEPEMFAMLLAGLGLTGALARRRSQRSAPRLTA